MHSQSGSVNCEQRGKDLWVGDDTISLLSLSFLANYFIKIHSLLSISNSNFQEFTLAKFVLNFSSLVHFDRIFICMSFCLSYNMRTDWHPMCSRVSDLMDNGKLQLGNFRLVTGGVAHIFRLTLTITHWRRFNLLTNRQQMPIQHAPGALTDSRTWYSLFLLPNIMASWSKDSKHDAEKPWMGIHWLGSTCARESTTGYSSV